MPVLNHFVNMRCGLGGGLMDDATALIVEAEVRAARALLRPGQVAVAPRCRVRGRAGMLEAGTLVQPDELPPVTDEHGVIVEVSLGVFQRHLQRGELIEAW